MLNDNNFVFLGDYNINPILDYLNDNPDVWQIEPIRVDNSDQYKVLNPSTNNKLKILLEPILDQLKTQLGNNVMQSVVTLLPAGDHIIDHADELQNAYRLHIPIITNDQVIFNCGGESKNMLPGQCWLFNHNKNHSIYNNGSTDRIHLLVDFSTEA